MGNLEKWRWKDTELKTVPGYFYDTCEKFSDREAQLFNKDLYNGDHDGIFTWFQMQERVEAIACGLLSIGAESKDRIGIMSESSPYWTHADMAIACIRSVSIAIFPTISFKEAEYILNDSQSNILFVGDDDILDKIKNHFNDIPRLKKIIVMDLKFKSDDNRILGLQDLIDKGLEWKKENYGKYLSLKDSVELDDWYTILYTSGTTGAGKGVILTHFNGASRMNGVGEFWERHNMAVDENDRTLCFLPLSHIFDRGSCQLTAIIYGASIAYADKPGTLLEDMQKYNPTWINCVPRLYEKIYIQFRLSMEQSPLKTKIFNWALSIGYKALEYRKDSNGCYNMDPSFDLKSKLPFSLKLRFSIADKLFRKVRALFGNRFRISFSASAGIAPDLLKFFYAIGLAVVEGYGSTESFNACILNPVTACKPGFMGINANGGQSRVAEDGELEISEAGIFQEYLNQPEATAEAFTEDGWFRTGDLVIQDDLGYYKIVDRKKAIICTAVGKNIAPAKLENLFSTSKYIEQIFLVGDERNYISALIVPNFNFFIELFEKEGYKYSKNKLIWDNSTGVSVCTEVGQDFVSAQRVQELIKEDVDRANEELESFEKIKQYVIMKERFTEKNGTLTPSQKTKKRVILQNYADEIETMYN